MSKKIIFYICLLLLILLILILCFINIRKNKDNVIPDSNYQINNGMAKSIPRDLFWQSYAKADELLSKMSVRQKVGQMFLVRFPESGYIEQIKEYNPGGYVLFAKDFQNETKNSIISKLKSCQEASTTKLFLAVDEEGGTVTRVSRYPAFRSSKFKSSQELYKEGGIKKILEDSTEKSYLLKEIGLNMNLAPVADLPTKPNSFIYKRSFGKSTEETAQYIASIISRMKDDGIVSSMKHFPGYGDNEDTHTGVAIDTRTIDNFKNADLLPFKAGIDASGPTILVSHNIIKCMDQERPASLSGNVHKILREELNFTGLILTDDLAMDAVKSYVENGEAAVQAVLAGNDLIITSTFKEHLNEVLTAINNGIISIDKINLAVKRILACKIAYGII